MNVKDAVDAATRSWSDLATWDIMDEAFAPGTDPMMVLAAIHAVANVLDMSAEDVARQYVEQTRGREAADAP